jgi:hypothetical protein
VAGGRAISVAARLAQQFHINPLVVEFALRAVRAEEDELVVGVEVCAPAVLVVGEPAVAAFRLHIQPCQGIQNHPARWLILFQGLRPSAPTNSSC